MIKQFLIEIKEILKLTNLHISKKRKITMYAQLFTVVLLIILQYFYPQKWIQYGIMPAILELVLFYLSISFIVNLIRIFFVSFYRKKNNLAPDHYDNLILAFDNLNSITINFIFLVLLFYLLGVDMKSFFTTIALFAVAITILFKEIFANFINGLRLMFSGNVKLREYITIDNYKGKIVNITLQNVELKTDDGDIVYVPNSIFMDKEVINYSKNSIKKINYSFLFPAEFYSEIPKLEKYLVKKISEEFANLVNPENIFIKIKTLIKDGSNLTLEVLVTKYSFKIEEKIIRFSSYEIVAFISKLNK